jgi:predicted  nucleic acid-binding Zn-ribbon protein
LLSDDLLALQRLDTSIDQAAYRRAHLAERDAAVAAAKALDDADRRRTAIDVRDGELEAAVAGLESDGAGVQQHRVRLEGQLRTVTSTRQAEALQHELATLAARRDELDDQELAHLEEQSTLAAERVALDAARPALASSADEAAAALGAAEGAVDAELVSLRAERDVVAGRIEPSMLDRYARLRSRFGGVAVGALEGSRCSGCHLDLSAAEVEAVRATPAGELVDCPQCGRLLVP